MHKDKNVLEGKNIHKDKNVLKGKNMHKDKNSPKEYDKLKDYKKTQRLKTNSKVTNKLKRTHSSFELI